MLISYIKINIRFSLSCLFLSSMVILSASASAQQDKPEVGKYRDSHKIVVYKDDKAGIQALGAVEARETFDYHDRKVLVISNQAIKNIPQKDREKLSVRDDLNKIYLRGRLIDTTKPVPSVPQALRQTPTTGNQQYLIQFAGPIKDEWLGEVKTQGKIKLISYLPNNAYLIWTDGPTIEKLHALSATRSFLQWMGAYHPAYRIHPGLQTATGDTKITVQLVAHEGVGRSVDLIKSKAKKVIRDVWSVGPYNNLRVTVSPADLNSIAILPDVVNIEPYQDPELGGERQGQILANQLNVAGSQPTGPGYLAWLNALGLNTTTDFVVDVADTGIDRGQTTAANLHQDFLDTAGNSRVAYVQQVTGTTIDTTAANNNDIGGHGTIDLSIVGGFNNTPDLPGAGTDFEDAAGYQYGLGIAPFAQLGSSRIFAPNWSNPDFTEMLNAAYNNGARITSNSWGNRGGASGDYDATSQEYDSLVRDAQPSTASDGGADGNQEMVVVFLAGNSGAGASTLWNTGSTAKNTLVVGAGENFNAVGDPDGCNAVTNPPCCDNNDADDARDVINFSSRGPTSSGGAVNTDNRVKPDIMAPGTHIFGAASQDGNYDGSAVCGGPDNYTVAQPNEDAYYPPDNCNDGPGGPCNPAQTLYTWSSGTSHATPAVAGSSALLRQWFINQGRPVPSPAMTKAYLMNSATWMTGTGANDNLPSNNQGMGRLNLERTFDIVPRLLVDQIRTFDNAGDNFTISGNIVDNAQPVRVTLAWTDALGATVGGAWVNDLDLEVTVDDGTGPLLYRGNVFNNNVSQTGGAADTRNNVESVWLPAGTIGEISVTVRASGINGDGVLNHGDGTDQDFALVLYNAELPARDPVDMVLVLDTSGSMGSIAEGGTDTKIDLLRDAVELFIKTWLPYSLPGDNIGVVFFDSSVSTFPTTGSLLQPFQPNSQAVIDAVRSEAAGGWTALGGGLQTALNALSASTNRKFVLMFSNGMQNFSPMVVSTGGGQHEIRTEAVGSTVDGIEVRGESGVAGATGVALSSYGIAVHTIGTGVSGAQWQDLIEDIATQTGGEHHFTSAPDADLELFFLEDLVTSLRGATLEMVAYRDGIFSDGEAAKTETFNLNASVKKASFLLSWRNERRPDALMFQLRKAGTAIPVGSSNAEVQSGDYYTLVTLDFPLRTKTGPVFPGGEWQMVISEQLQSGSVPFRVVLLVDDTDIKYDFLIPKTDYGVGEPIKMMARVTDSGLPVTNLSKAEVIVSTPSQGLGTFLSKHAVLDKQVALDQDHFSTPVAKKEYLLFQDPKLREEYAPSTTIINLFDDGKSEHGDEIAHDGIYTAIYESTNLPGHYSFEFHIDGTAPVGGAFSRQHSVATTVRIKAIGPANTQITFESIQDNRTRVVLTPIDRYGNYLGPGYSHVISLEVKEGELVGPLKDNLDGSYSQVFEIKPDKTGIITIDVLGTQIEEPVPERTLWWWWILLLALLLLVIVIWFIRRSLM